MQVPDGDAVELDCLGLSYCSAGGTGRALEGGAFPGDYDVDADGFGAIFRGTTGDFQLGVGATADRSARRRVHPARHDRQRRPLRCPGS